MRYLILLVFLAGCSTSTYEYKKGDAYFIAKSRNEIEELHIKLNRETGDLEVDLGGLTKNSDVETVVNGIDSIVGNVVKASVPGDG